MSGKKFVVSGLNMMDKVVLPDGRSSWNLGGIPMYGFAGMRFWTESSEDIAFGARVGKDFMDYYGDWFNANHIDAGDLITVSDKTPYSIYVYDEKYDVKDVRFFTGDFADSRLWRPHGEDFEQWTGDETLGVYICCSPDDPCLDLLTDLKLKYSFKIMWEPNYISTFEKFRDSTESLMEKIDMASFNVPEGCRIFGLADEALLLEKLKDFNKEMILLRCGARGLYTVFGRKSVFIESLVSPVGVIDVTGCGNTSTSGAFCAKCLGDDPVMSAIKGNISSNYNLRQKGPYPLIDEKVCNEARDWAQKIYKTIGGTH